MDAFSEILSGVKLNGAVFFSAEFSAPWGFSAPASGKMAIELAPGAAHLVLYHFVIDGEALVQAALIHARSFRQIAEARGLSGQEWERYFAKRLWECLNSLAVVYGFANADRIHKT